MARSQPDFLSITEYGLPSKIGLTIKLLTLTTGILGHISQINTRRISLDIFRTIKASSGEYRHLVCWCVVYFQKKK